LIDVHPECIKHNDEEIKLLSKVVRDEHNIIIDDLHKTIPYLTKYEKARVIGVRAKQINMGAQIFIDVDPTIIDGAIIAEKELLQRKMPFIIRRPLPGGGSEYWNLSDLEII
jgi:DNA-directed RNA polymerase I, II, and III subunit RPABC2